MVKASLTIENVCPNANLLLLLPNANPTESRGVAHNKGSRGLMGAHWEPLNP